MSNKLYPRKSFVAESIGYAALDVLHGSRKAGRVHSIFDGAVNIEFRKNSLIGIIKDKNYISPTTILLKIPKNKSFRSLALLADMKVRVKNNSLIFGDDTVEVSLARADTWVPPELDLKTSIDLMRVGLNLMVLKNEIFKSPSMEGLVPLLRNLEMYGPVHVFLRSPGEGFSEKARPYIETIMWGLYTGNIDLIIECALSIFGLGPGLTPSCDDFLGGLMLALLIGGKALISERKRELSYHKRVCRALYGASKGKTTIYGENFLKGAQRGEAPKAIIDLIHSFLTKDIKEVKNAASTVVAMGETSGADIAIGIFYGMRFLLSKLERIEDLGII